jgi:hypothetical protein
MAKITITIEDHDEALASVKWNKEPAGQLDGGGSPAEQIAYLTLSLLHQAKYEGSGHPVGESN